MFCLALMPNAFCCFFSILGVKLVLFIMPIVLLPLFPIPIPLCWLIGDLLRAPPVLKPNPLSECELVLCAIKFSFLNLASIRSFYLALNG